MGYITYSEYKIWGGELSETEFGRYEFQAQRLINKETFGRLSGYNPIPDEVKRLSFELIALAHKSDITAEKVSSERVGGWQRSYKSYSPASYAKTSRDLIRTYLTGIFDSRGVPLLYKGVDA